MPGWNWKQYMKPIFVVSAYAALATFLWAFFLSRSLGIHGLKRQIARLEGEVTKLDGHIDDLEIEIDRLVNVTGELSDLNIHLETSVAELGDVVASYAELNEDFDINLVEQNKLNLALNDSMIMAKELNAALDKSTTDLNESQNTISDINSEMTETIENTKNLNDQLKVTTDQISKTDGTLSDRLDELRDENTELETLNVNLEESNDNLLAVLSYIEEAGNEFEGTFESMMNELGTSINYNRELVLFDLELLYEMKYENWLCDGVFEFNFRNSAWVDDRDLSIGNDYDDVITFLETNLFSELCIASDDFNFFVSNDNFIYANPPSTISFSELISAIERYSTELIKYYFPANNKEGLSEQNWIDADYQCDNFPTTLIFQYQF